MALTSLFLGGAAGNRTRRKNGLELRKQRNLTTRNDAKRREMTCGYAASVDGINMRGASVVGAVGDTPGMTEDSWNTRDLRVLRAVVDIYDESGTHLTRATTIEQNAGLDAMTVQRALRRLDSQPSFLSRS